MHDIAISDRAEHRSGAAALRIGLTAIISLAILWGAFYLSVNGQPLLGALMLGLGCVVALVYGTGLSYGARFIVPGIAAVLIFIAFPVGYTIYLGFTNYSSFNLLTQDRTTEVLLSHGAIDPATETPFAIAPGPDGYRIWLPDPGLLSGLLSGPLALAGSEESADLAPADAPATLLERRDALAFRDALAAVTVVRPDGVALRNSSLRAFAAITPEFEVVEAGVLRRVADGALITANPATGFYETENGERLPPGWRVAVGWDNFTRVFTSEGIRGPMISIFIWTFIFAFASVAITFALGVLLAVILQWEHLRFRAVYRIALILPYAVPAFISILVFRGLFNQNFGEINVILGNLFGLRPTWFTDGTLARIMILIVNSWLGYPYMMLLAMGFLQSVPQDHKKAAALEGASSLRVFFTITLPQIIPPFLPLLIASFAFNFNNLVLVLLLTRGLPDIPGTVIPAGKTDILASFTYRMAFNDSAQQFGLAGAITLLIFLVVAAISYANFVAMRRVAQRRSGRPA